MPNTKFEVKFNEPKRPAPENLLSPRERDSTLVKMRVEQKLSQADERRKSQIGDVVQKQKKHVSQSIPPKINAIFSGFYNGYFHSIGCDNQFETISGRTREGSSSQSC